MLRVWRHLPPERRLAAGAAIGLFVTLFLPWYQETVILGSNLKLASASITGWGAFSFVEAAVLLVAASVLALLFVRAEGRAFHVPGGDGGVITAAGLWTGVLIVWRIFDKQSGHSNHGQYLTTSGIEWGIFVALGVAGLMVYAGSQIRSAHEPEPPRPGERVPPPADAGAGADARVRAGAGGAPSEDQTQPLSVPAARRRSRDPGPPELEEIEFEDAPTARLRRSKRAPVRAPEPAADDGVTTRVDHRPG